MRRPGRMLAWALAVSSCAVALAGCGGSTHAGPTAYCVSGCAKVSGRVEECGGPTSRRCRVAGFVQVALLDRRGQLVTAEHSGTVGPRLRRFSPLYPGSGIYILETKLIGERVTTRIRLRRGHTLNVNLVIPIK